MWSSFSSFSGFCTSLVAHAQTDTRSDVALLIRSCKRVWVWFRFGRQWLVMKAEGSVEGERVSEGYGESECIDLVREEGRDWVVG